MTTNALIVFSYNQEIFVEKCVHSLLSMTHLPDRIVWFDDASTDETYKKVVESTSKAKNVEIYRNQKNIGLYGNLNNAFRDWQCDYVHFLACDDSFSANYFEDFNKFISDNNIEKNEKCVVLSNHISLNGSTEKTTNYNKNDLALGSFLRGKITTRTLGISAALFNQLKKYNHKIGIWADRLWEIELIFAAERLYLMDGAYHRYTVGVGVSSRQKRADQIYSLITVNKYLLDHGDEYKFSSQDKRYLKFSIARDELKLRPSFGRLLIFMGLFILNLKNGARLQDFKCFIPDKLIPSIKKLSNLN